jgi:hypothetical protein
MRINLVEIPVKFAVGKGLVDGFVIAIIPAIDNPGRNRNRKKDREIKKGFDIHASCASFLAGAV